eukprot:TRINITY_DN8713_c0_g1_i3.p1 TRINITY_DN8713_c0_g1~~TRINITY_DN8713_c0_g1_i3.p1  ORF type:complete len:310 (+),score=60.16 TRINITY_DN8713_c0_g1_i3:117-1046(+)
MNPKEPTTPNKVSFRRSSIREELVCKLCNGLLRFAQTLVECGHSYCKSCLTEFIQGNRNPKCPRCEHSIEKTFMQSIRKDSFKQSLVDILYPSYAAGDTLLVKRTRELLPELEIQRIVDSYNYTKAYPNTRRLKARRKAELNVKDIVNRRFGIGIEAFGQAVMDEDRFQELKARKAKHDAMEEASALAKESLRQIEDEHLTFNLFPRMDADFEIAQVKNKVRLKLMQTTKDVEGLKKLVMKTIQNNLKKKGLKELDSQFTDIKKMEFYTSDRQLSDNDTLQDIFMKNGKPDDSVTISYHFNIGETISTR